MIEIVHEIRLAKGRKAKQAVLAKYKNNCKWLYTLVAMYDSSINYYVSSPIDSTFKENEDIESMLDDLSFLSSRYITGNKAKQFALEMSNNYGEIVRLVLGGSLRSGISIKTINTVYPDLIPTFDVMLAKNIDTVNFPILASTKFDGVRVVVFNNGDSISIVTRSGKELKIESLINSFKNQPVGVYDGELVFGNGLQESRTKITGFVNRVLKGSISDIKGYTYQVFDKLSLNEWSNKDCTRDYLTRLRDLNGGYSPDEYIKIIEYERLLSSSDIESLFSLKLSKGYEGIILRYPGDPYVWCRTHTLIKKKALISCVLRCIATTEGTGKYEGMIGALLCKGVIDDKHIEVKVGTGLSDFDRYITPDDYIGKDIDIEYNDIVRSKNRDTWSLFLPVFKRIALNTDI